MTEAASKPPRAVRLGPEEAVFDRRPDGSLIVRSKHPLDAYPAKITERLEHWARVTPERVFLAQRDGSGNWRRISYSEALASARSTGQALLVRGLSPDRPLAILSGNDLEHALLALGALYVGIPYAPVSPAYSLLSGDYGKLLYIMKLLTPGLVFAVDGERFAGALAAARLHQDWPDAELVVTKSPPKGLQATAFADLLAEQPSSDVDAAHSRVAPDTIAKILFTSGSTGTPKGVINTQRMLTSNQVMIRSAMAFLEDEPPVIVDWLPWNHTFGGNHNFGLVPYNGGSLHIDDGKPLPPEIEQSIINLREVAPTVYFNVPKGYEMLIPFLRRDVELRRNFFSRLKLLFYAAASLPQHVWGALEELAIETCGERVRMITGLGATESAPLALVCTRQVRRAGIVGLPAPGVELKLVPDAGKLEARLRGPNIMPGYWRQDELTKAAFDEEGFYKLGDALRFLDADDPQQGFVFDGRIAEDFKLATGTWVSVGPLRAKFIAHLAPFVRDVVIAGHGRDYLAALILPDPYACRELCPDLPGEADLHELLNHPSSRAAFTERMTTLARRSTGSSNQIMRAIILTEPLSIDRDEVTDKGSVNQRAVLANRAEMVEELYAPTPSARVICVNEGNDL